MTTDLELERMAQLFGWDTTKENPNHDPDNGQFTSGPGGGGGGGTKPTWAGSESTQHDGETLHRGKFALNANKWAVDTGNGPGPFRDTPQEAVHAHRQVLAAGESNRQSNQARNAAMDAIRQNKPLSSAQIGAIAGGGKNVTRTAAHGILRELGVPEKDAKVIVGRLGMYGESSGGASYHSVDELVKRYNVWRDTGKA